MRLTVEMVKPLVCWSEKQLKEYANGRKFVRMQTVLKDRSIPARDRIYLAIELMSEEQRRKFITLLLERVLNFAYQIRLIEEGSLKLALSLVDKWGRGRHIESVQIRSVQALILPNLKGHLQLKVLLLCMKEEAPLKGLAKSVVAQTSSVFALAVPIESKDELYELNHECIINEVLADFF